MKSNFGEFRADGIAAFAKEIVVGAADQRLCGEALNAVARVGEIVRSDGCSRQQAGGQQQTIPA